MFALKFELSLFRFHPSPLKNVLFSIEPHDLLQVPAFVSPWHPPHLYSTSLTSSPLPQCSTFPLSKPSCIQQAPPVPHPTEVNLPLSKPPCIQQAQPPASFPTEVNLPSFQTSSYSTNSNSSPPSSRGNPPPFINLPVFNKLNKSTCSPPSARVQPPPFINLPVFNKLNLQSPSSVFSIHPF